MSVILISGCQIAKRPARLPDFGPYRVVGYVGSRMEISHIDPTRVTHLNYAFARLNEQGELFFRSEESVLHLAQLNALKNLNPRLKILLSVGGWGADHFSDAALTYESRQRFARGIVQCLTDYDLDGVDIDWEYPGQPGPGIAYREEDRRNFTLMLKTVREHLDARSEETGRDYLLTIATDGSRRYFEHTEMELVQMYVDFINVMTYDFYTSGSETTGHHTGLYKSSFEDSSEKNAASAIALHLEAGIPPEKIVLGVAFYGRGWTGVGPSAHGLFQTYDRFTQAYTYSLLLERYINQRGFDRYWDEAAHAPYLWNPDSTTFISYEDPESLKYKADFIKAQGLGGVMFWEYSHDAEGELLDTLVKALEM